VSTKVDAARCRGPYPPLVVSGGGDVLGKKLSGEALGNVLGDPLGEALGEVLGEALGEALGNTLGEALCNALGDVTACGTGADGWAVCRGEE